MQEEHTEVFYDHYGCFTLLENGECPEPVRWLGTIESKQGRSHTVWSCDGHRGGLTNVLPTVGIIDFVVLQSIDEYEELAAALEEIAWALKKLDLMGYKRGFRWRDQLDDNGWPIFLADNVGDKLKGWAEKIRRFDHGFRSDD
jgi:hypothetical protein